MNCSLISGVLQELEEERERYMYKSVRYREWEREAERENERERIMTDEMDFDGHRDRLLLQELYSESGSLRVSRKFTHKLLRLRSPTNCCLQDGDQRRPRCNSFPKA